MGFTAHELDLLRDVRTGCRGVHCSLCRRLGTEEGAAAEVALIQRGLVVRIDGSLQITEEGLSLLGAK